MRHKLAVIWFLLFIFLSLVQYLDFRSVRVNTGGVDEFVLLAWLRPLHEKSLIRLVEKERISLFTVYGVILKVEVRPSGYKLIDVEYNDVLFEARIEDGVIYAYNYSSGSYIAMGFSPFLLVKPYRPIPLYEVLLGGSTRLEVHDPLSVVSKFYYTKPYDSEFGLGYASVASPFEENVTTIDLTLASGEPRVYQGGMTSYQFVSCIYFLSMPVNCVYPLPLDLFNPRILEARFGEYWPAVRYVATHIELGLFNPSLSRFVDGLVKKFEYNLSAVPEHLLYAARDVEAGFFEGYEYTFMPLYGSFLGVIVFWLATRLWPRLRR